MLRHLLRLLQLSLGAFLVSMSFTSPAHAKKITLEWAPTKQALYYEIQVQDSSGKKPVHRHVDQSRYQANLNPGVYFWQIRAIDRLKRPGRWSDPEPLVVMATPPSLQSPEAGSEIKFYHPSATVLFKWKSAPGATAYVFTLSKDGSVLSEKEVKGNTFETSVPDSGHYTWTVRSVMAPGAGAPAAFQSRRWQSDSAKAVPLSIEYSTLANAKIIEPSGKTPLPEKGILHFAWSAVENADSYEVRLKTGSSTEKTYRTKKTSINIALKDLGPIEETKPYHWTVRPIPLRAPASFTQGNSEVGLSSADFEFSTETRSFLRRGIVEFSSSLAPTSYRFVAPDTSSTGNTSAITSGFRISGDRYLKGRFGYGASFENIGLQIASQSYALHSFEIGAHYRKALSEKENGWLLNAHLGVGWQEYIEIFPTVSGNLISGASNLKVSTLGPASSVDLKRFLSDHWTIQFNFGNYLPLMKMGSSQVSSLQSAGLLDNTTLGARVGWESRYWGYTAGMVQERRSTKFSRILPDGSVSTHTDESSSSAFSLFAGVSYSFY